MTRKHFTRIAAALKLCRPESIHFEEAKNYEAARSDWRAAVNDMCNMCAGCNAAFDAFTFLDACGLND